MKIAQGMFYHEANSFNPSYVYPEDFTCIRGEEALERMFATEIFLAEKAELVPLLYVNTLPNGICSLETYESFAQEFLSIIKQNDDLDGIMLHLHGSMEVEKIGSGEYDLITRIREIVGNDVIIGLALDPHSNNHPDLASKVNVIRSYRTVPHSDQKETEQIVAKHMIDCIKNNKKTIPQYVRLPYAIHPEKALGATWPLKEIFERLGELEQREEVAVASLCIGMIWCDCKTLASNIIVTPSEEKYTGQCKKIAEEFGEYVYSLRDSFEYEQIAMDPKEAVKLAIFSDDSTIFISDSGDNTTGGAVGDHTIMLREFLKHKDQINKKIIVTSIWDEKAVAECLKYQEGDEITLEIGKNTSPDNKAVQVSGTIKKIGELMGYMGLEDDATGKAITISSGNLDVAITDKPSSFISRNHFVKGSGAECTDYDVVVVKQGYLFPQLRELAKLSILALTPGATHQLVETLSYYNILPPVYPLKYVDTTKK